MREVREETGYVFKLIASIPETFESDSCITKYYLVKPTGTVHQFDHETKEVRWVSTEEAFELISLIRT